VISYSSTVNARMIFNADFYDEGSAYLGGIAAIITNWLTSSGIIEVNGNIYAKENVGLYCGGNQAAGRVVVNGNIFSNTRPVFVDYQNSCFIKNAVIVKGGSFAASAVRIFQNGKLYMSNVQIYSETANTTLIRLDSVTSKLYLYNVVGESVGTSALSIDAVGPVNVQIHGSRFNKNKGVNVTDELIPSGFVFDPLVVVPKF
jgi:hypothetical protein